MLSISKIVKNKLNESSFDDLFDDIYDPDESFYDSSEIKDMFKIEHLIDCKTDADIIYYLDERFNLNDILIKLIYDIINELKIKKDNFELS
jgi:regulator of sigma D